MRLIKQLTVAALALLASKGLADPVLPSSDGFYTPPDGYESTTPGTVLRHRAVPNPIPDMDNVEGAFQILYRTTDSLGNATATVTTLIVPMNATNDKLVSYKSLKMLRILVVLLPMSCNWHHLTSLFNRL